MDYVQTADIQSSKSLNEIEQLCYRTKMKVTQLSSDPLRKRVMISLGLLENPIPGVAQGLETIMRIRRPLRLEPHIHMALECLADVVQTVSWKVRRPMTALVEIGTLEDLDTLELVKHSDGVRGDTAIRLVEVDSVSA